MDVDTIRNLYLTENLSAQEIGNRIGKTVWQVLRFMKKHGINRRTNYESRHLQFVRSPLSFSKRNLLSSTEKQLLIAGLMLYNAEGGKTDKYTVDMANSDLTIIKIFLKMLQQIYQINYLRLRIFLYCYPNQNTQEIVNYWSRNLSVPLKQFTKPYVRKDFDPHKINKMPYGLIHIRYSDSRLLSQIKQDIGIISSEILSRDTQAVNESGL